jgi:hypothetical protein
MQPYGYDDERKSMEKTREKRTEKANLFQIQLEKESSEEDETTHFLTI